MLLKKPDRGVHDDDDADRDGIQQFAEYERHDGCSQQQPDHGAGELTHKQNQRARRGLAPDFVGTEFGQSALRFT